MSAELRKLGYNIKNAAQKKYATVEDFTRDVNLSVEDVQRVFHGRAILSFAQIKEISDKVGVSIEDLLDTSVELPVDCVGEFEDTCNKDAILDIIDDYIDIVDAVY